jgi:D-lactate dehydrogenase
MALIYFYDATEIDRQQLTEGLRATDHRWEYVEERIDIDNLNPDTEVISVFVTSTITREIMDRLPKLRLIALRSTGYNNVDLTAANERDIVVTNVPSYGEQTVAEYTFTLLLALSRKLSQTIRSHDRPTITLDELRGFDLAGKTIGIIGTGRIGRKVARIAHGFAMNILAYDPYPDEEAAREFHMQYVSLEELLETSDIVSLHVPYTKATRHIINKEGLQKMKSSAILINTARGELIDTEALTIALTSQQLAGAGLDVLEGESLWHLDDNIALLKDSAASPSDTQHGLEQLALSRLPNVLMTPHNAFNTIEAIGRINTTTCDNIIKFWYDDIPNRISTQPTTQNYGKLILVRHAESEWNATGRWTGVRDRHLSERGFRQGARFGRLLKELDITIDQAYCSQQIRALETLEVMLDSSGQFDVPYDRSKSLNERDYGDYTGMNKWQVKEQLGEEVFNKLRRSWDFPIPNGETLKMVYERVVPFYTENILPNLKKGNNILLVAHGNSLRALMKYIEKLSDTEVGELNMLLGEIVTYEIDDKGIMISKRVDQIELEKTNA